MSQHRTPDDDTEADRALDGRPAATPARSAASPANPPADSWGRTLPLDAAGLRGQFTPPAPTSERPEPAVRVARNVYATGTSGPPPEVEGSAEPLRVPSNRPAPSPYQTNKASEKGTMLMGSTAIGQPQRSVPVAAPPVAVPAPRPHSAVRAVAHAAETIPLANSDAGTPPVIAAPPPAAKSPRAPEPVPAAAQPVAAARPRTRQVEPPQSRSQPPFASTADAEPLLLQLNERDVVPSQVSMPPGVAGRGPVLAIVGAVIAIGVGVALWLMSSSGETPNAVAPEPAAAAAPAAPSAVQPAVPAARTAAVPSPPPAAAAAVPPSAPAAPVVRPEAKREAQEPKAAPEKADKPATSKKHASAKPTAKQKAKAKKSASSAPVSDDVAAARDALRALESEPVMSVKRKPAKSSDESDLAPPDPSPPAPPSPD